MGSSTPWDDVKSEIVEILCSPQYLRTVGFVDDPNQILNGLKVVYSEFEQTHNEKGKSPADEAIMVYCAKNAIDCYKWVINHRYYNPPQKNNGVINWITKNPLLSALLGIIFAIVMAAFIYKLHPWSKPASKESDVQLKRIANNIEDIRKVNLKINNIESELSILATPIYENLYDRELKRVSRMIYILQNANADGEMPQYNENRALFGKARYAALIKYSTELEEYMLRNGVEDTTV